MMPASSPSAHGSASASNPAPLSSPDTTSRPSPALIPVCEALLGPRFLPHPALPVASQTQISRVSPMQATGCHSNPSPLAFPHSLCHPAMTTADPATLGAYFRAGAMASGHMTGAVHPGEASLLQPPHPSMYQFHNVPGLGPHEGGGPIAPPPIHPHFAPASALCAYDSPYPYMNAYGALDPRRKNATKESTNTLKAWLFEHKKNPYPTKGEKIMLAILTRMTLTQVSTWFANARRRLKKENKATWSESKDDDEDDDDDDDLDSEKGDDDVSGCNSLSRPVSEVDEREFVDVEGADENDNTTTLRNVAITPPPSPPPGTHIRCNAKGVKVKVTRASPALSSSSSSSLSLSSLSPNGSLLQDPNQRPKASCDRDRRLDTEGDAFHPTPTRQSLEAEAGASNKKPKIWSVADMMGDGAVNVPSTAESALNSPRSTHFPPSLIPNVTSPASAAYSNRHPFTSGLHAAANHQAMHSQGMMSVHPSLRCPSHQPVNQGMYYLPGGMHIPNLARNHTALLTPHRDGVKEA